MPGRRAGADAPSEDVSREDGPNSGELPGAPAEEDLAGTRLVIEPPAARGGQAERAGGGVTITAPVSAESSAAVLNIGEVWPRVVELASAARRLKNVVAEVSLAVLEENVAVFEADTLMLPVVHASRADLEELLRRACGRNFKAEVRPRSGTPARVPVVAGPLAAAARAGGGGEGGGPEAAAAPAIDPTSSPLVREAIRVFGARVIGVQARRHEQAEGRG